MRRATAGAMTLALLGLAGAAHAEDGWALDPSGDWVQTLPARREPIAVDDPSSAATIEPLEDTRERRSGLAIAGGVVVTVVGTPIAALGGLGLIYAGATDGHPEAYATSAAVMVTGLATVGGGVALIVWGAQKQPTARVSAGPGQAYVSGTF
jgi:hypothetical protein